MTNSGPHVVSDISQLVSLYNRPLPKVAAKVQTTLNLFFRELIGRATFVVLATSGSTGIETSARGGPPGFIFADDDKTLLLPDRIGNNRIDSLRNIIEDPRVGLLFNSPDDRQILRVKGTATISTDPALIRRFIENDRLPNCVLIIEITAVLSQCRKAKIRAGMWQETDVKHI